jgi:Na+-translocating ferredoxin:NAD+ oxidoreductase RnfG subunit
VDKFNVFLSCFTNAGVSFTMSAVVMAGAAMEAGNKACEHVMKHGGQVTLMAGAPAMPVQVVYAVPQRIDKLSPSGVILGVEDPGLTRH